MTDNIHSDPPSQDKPDERTYTAETAIHISSILIVEDNVELAEMLSITARRMQLLPYIETLGEKAINFCQQMPLDLVLLDLNLPDMNGWKVLDAIMETRSVSGRPAVVIITAYADPANRLMGKLQGIDGYLVKPFLPQEAERVINEVLGPRKG